MISSTYLLKLTDILSFFISVISLRKEYILLLESIQNGEKYFLAVEAIDNAPTDKYEIFKEIIIDGEISVEEVIDEELRAKLLEDLENQIDDKFYACMVNADREINEVKLGKLLNAASVELASEEDVMKITKAKVGFAGPVGLDIPIIMDEDIKCKKNFIVGANKSDYHFTDVNLKDFEPTIVADIKNIKEGDICPKCGGKIMAKKIAKNIKFEEALAELEEQVRLLESGELSLEQSLEVFKYGIELSKICMGKLDTVKQEVEKIVATSDDDYKLETFHDLEA